MENYDHSQLSYDVAVLVSKSVIDCFGLQQIYSIPARRTEIPPSSTHRICHIGSVLGRTASIVLDSDIFSDLAESKGQGP